MGLVPAGDLLIRAAGRSEGIGAFNVIQLEHAEAILDGAARAGNGVILQISENCVRYHGSLAPLGRAVLTLAAASEVPSVVHLDHVTDLRLVEEALDLRLGSVMFDGSRLAYADNVATTAAVVRACRSRGVMVEAELGAIGGKDGVHAPGARTDPEQAAEFVAATGVDALAVAVGSSHAMLERTARLDHRLIEDLRGAVPVPLVLHGSSGVPDAELRRAVSAGITKVNVATRLNKVYTAAIREQLADPALVDPRRYVGTGRLAVSREVERLMAVLRAAG